MLNKKCVQYKYKYALSAKLYYFQIVKQHNT